MKNKAKVSKRRATAKKQAQKLSNYVRECLKRVLLGKFSLGKFSRTLDMAQA